MTELDAALGGLFWGDNVVWELEENGSSLTPFVSALMSAREQFSNVVLVKLEGDSERLQTVYPGVDVLDARRGAAIETAGELLVAVRECLQRAPRTLVVFDALDALSDRWGHQIAQRFFTRVCPLVLGFWAVGYWSLTPGRHSAQLRQAVDAAQCVLVLTADRLRVAKAEGRPQGVQGSVLRIRFDGQRTELEPAPTAARLGAALRAVRIQRHLSQGELARLAGVSASAISQAERGRCGLALDTVLDLSSALDMTIDELLRGEIALGYRLARRTRGDDAAARLVPLLDDRRAGLRVRLSSLAPGQSVRAQEAHEGVELVAVAAGRVQVVLPTGRPVLRQGEALLVERSGATGWRNVGDRNALIFWVMRDELEPQPAFVRRQEQV